jgi:anti-repressor protein
MSERARTNAPDPMLSFTFPDRDWEIRVATIAGEPWFVGPDLAAAFGAEYTAAVIARLPRDDRELLALPTGSELELVSEPAVYELALGSGHPAARSFLCWITHDVLPAVRRIPVQLDRRELARLVIEAEDARERAEARAGELESVTADFAAKAEAFDAFLDNGATYSMGAVANLLGIGRNTLFRRLREEKILQEDNRPYQRYAHHFRVTAGNHEQNGREVAHHTTRVHASGVEFIRRRLARPALFAVAELPVQAAG